ncbi:hypothetical protein FD754_018818 [Muntiacus muntjak]|uniref:Mammalian ependymin-related protein 1 n=1 Tax=Muntiacus muntjak TaxID=9888 RepID=A0A5N3UYG5_MUNMU|nr:hypothetical protein FD754_018818 [Muntiacus muntjak]
MPGRAPLRVARGSLDAWLLGSLWVCALGCFCGVGTAAPGAGGALGAQRPCQVPQQWEGRQVLYRQSTGRYSRALLSYDGLNQRVRVLDERKALIPCKRYAGRGKRGRGGPGRERELHETWIGIYTVKDCYPVQETFTKNYSVILSTRFFDIQLGIKDPSVFTPPSTCQTAQPKRMSEDCSW